MSGLFWVLTIPNVKSKSLDPASFIETVFGYCKEKLEYSEAKYLKPTALILGAIVKSSGTQEKVANRYSIFRGIFWNVATCLERAKKIVLDIY